MSPESHAGDDEPDEPPSAIQPSKQGADSPSEGQDPMSSDLGRIAEIAGRLAGDRSTPDLSEALAFRATQSESYKGPIAHPKILRELDEVIPGAAERAFHLSEVEQSHRHTMDEKLVDAQVRSSDTDNTVQIGRLSNERLAIWLVAALAVLALLVGGGLALSGHTPGLYVLGGGSALGIGAAVVTGQRRRGKSASEE